MKASSRARDLLIVRTHLSDHASLSAYDRYAAADCFDVVFCCDERTSPVNCGERNKVRLDNDRLTSLGLYPHKNCGWRCGDYFYYVTRAERPTYQFYWMVEPDVFINWGDPADFFRLFRESTADLLAAKLGERDSRWGWYETVKDAYPSVYGCYFPLTRLSARAIDQCLTARRAHSLNPSIKPATWPNDEAFVANELLNNGFVCADFNSIGQDLYTATSFRPAVPHNAHELLEKPPDQLFYHPMGDFAQWLEELSGGLQTRLLHQTPANSKSVPPLLRRSGAIQLARAAEVLLRAKSDAALVPLLFARHGWQQQAWTSSRRKNDISERFDPRKAEISTRKFKVHFGPKGKETLATVQVGAAKPKLGKLKVSSADDFVLSPPEPLGRFPKDFAIPYAFDFESRELLYTLHMNPKTLLRQPFLYAAQRQRAVVVARVPWNRLNKLYGRPNSRQPPMFIFSIGRTGSTLLETMLACITESAVSEPDSITQLAISRRKLQSLSDKLRKHLMWHSVAPFLAAGDGRRTVPRPIKLRSQMNPVVTHVLEAFPDAQYVFMLRELDSWARSTFRAFGLSPEKAARRLRMGHEALRTLASSSKNVTVVRYEQLISDPLGALEAIIGREKIRSADTDAVMKVLQEDSQANTSISRERLSKARPNEAAWLDTFHESWNRLQSAGDDISSGFDADAEAALATAEDELVG